VLAHVMRERRLLGEQPLADKQLNRLLGLRRAGEELVLIEVAEQPAVALDRSCCRRASEVEDDPARLTQPVGVTQDADGVLRLDSSERPGEEDEVELAGRCIDLVPGCDLETHSVTETRGQCSPGGVDVLHLWLGRKPGAGRPGEGKRQPALTAADLEHPAVGEVGEPARCGCVRALRIEDFRHRAILAPCSAA
jgi:hypothetical protein